LHVLFHSFVDLEILYSTSGEELSGGAISTFSIRPMAELDFVGINIAVDDVFFNLVTKDTQIMRSTIPWRGGREKDPLLLQMLIESTT
jgi:hypothetical protein